MNTIKRFSSTGPLSMTRLQTFLVLSCMLMNLWIAPAMATVAPTASPTAIPSLVVNVDQTVIGLTQAAYEAERDAYDRTIKNAVVDNVAGITLDQVSVLSMQDIKDNGYISLPAPNVTLTGPPVPKCLLNYQIQTSSPSVTLTTVYKQLTNAAQTGKMDESLHYYAQMFGASSLVSSSLAVPVVTNAADSEHTSDKPTSGEIAGIVIGSVVFIAVLVGIVFLLHKKQYTFQWEAASATGQEPLKQVEVAQV